MANALTGKGRTGAPALGDNDVAWESKRTTTSQKYEAPFMLASGTRSKSTGNLLKTRTETIEVFLPSGTPTGRTQGTTTSTSTNNRQHHHGNPNPHTPKTKGSNPGSTGTGVRSTAVMKGATTVTATMQRKKGTI
jgi:hypothetical protein